MIYLDYNSSAPLNFAAKAWMAKAIEYWGNPNSTHRVGRQAAEFMEECRGALAQTIQVPADQVVFTSGGSEANTSVIVGARLHFGPTFRLLTTATEHSSISGTLELLGSMGAEIKILPVTSEGAIDPEVLQTALKDFYPHLVSIMAVNNETGVIHPIPSFAEMVHANGALLHTDAVQAFGKIPVSDFAAADCLSLSAHKIGGLKGVGAMVVRPSMKLMATHHGGPQEKKRRGGTQNMIGIASLAGAASVLPGPQEWDRQRKLREKMEKQLDAKIQSVGTSRNPNTSNLRFSGIAADVLLGALDLDGICVSAGSACSSGSLNPSPTLLAMGLDRTAAMECIRVSLGVSTTEAEIDEFVRVLSGHVERIRKRRNHVG